MASTVDNDANVIDTLMEIVYSDEDFHVQKHYLSFDVVRQYAKESLVAAKGETSDALDQLWTQLELLRIAAIQQTTVLPMHRLISIISDEFHLDLIDSQYNEFLAVQHHLCHRVQDEKVSEQLAHQLSEEMSQNEESSLQQLQAIFPLLASKYLLESLKKHNNDLTATADALFHGNSGSESLDFKKAITKGRPQTAPTLSNTPCYATIAPNFVPETCTSVKSGAKKLHKVETTQKSLRTSATSNIENAWMQCDEYNWQESKLATKLRCDRLNDLFPDVGRDVLETAFYMNHCNSDATEAIIREIYGIEWPSQPPVPPEPPIIPCENVPPPISDCSFASKQVVVQEAHELVQQRFRDLMSCRTHQRTPQPWSDRVQALSSARSRLRQAQRDAADAFFSANAHLIS
uniref:AlNc14C56G4275 protein n=1 Tax=Albugo laibachii Nc14 TaxID=890382 RepID=F0WC92_9STRA|nr:AlNc14C56G4275 [Albugo laibachii Nc14]|eukprot:CCA18805.1 AlNc14C56G4275 [Albugo laibachii Nc14]